MNPLIYQDLDWDLKRPCADCPFRKSSPFHEGVAAGVFDLFHLLDEHRFAHTCHKTDPRSDSPEGKRWKGRTKHCRGALIMLVKTGKGKDLQLPLLKAAEDGKLDLEELTRVARKDKDCYTLLEFMVFLGRESKALIERRERERLENRPH